jgi:dipeptidyl aminopeptidase/acylaminoacyl peptidase
VLWLLDVDSAVARPLCRETVDVADPVSMCWDEDGASLVFSRAHRGCHQIAALRVQDQSVTVMAGGDRQLSAFCATPSHLVYAVDHPSQPSEVWVTPRSGAAAVQDERQLSRLNPWWDARDPIETRSISFEVPDGRGGKETVQGWLLRRRGSTGPQPLLCDIHGGPASYAPALRYQCVLAHPVRSGMVGAGAQCSRLGQLRPRILQASGGPLG